MKRTVFLLACAVPLLAQVKIARVDGKVSVEIDGKPFTALYDHPKPYLHPLRTAGGVIVTRRFPMENVEGETRDHRHHRGLWFTHGNVNGLDFWMNEDDYDKPKGKIVAAGTPSLSSGAKKGTIKATYEWQEASGNKLLRETRVFTFHSHPVNRIVDVDITLEALNKVKFGDTKEGTFAIRLADVLSEKKTGTMTNAQGAKKMKDVWGKPSPWVDYVGQIDGKTVGIAILDHPSNPRHPTHWHSRDYGLFAANIFGEHDFYKDKSRDASMTLEPGKKVRFRYRVVIHPGGTEEAKVSELFKQFAAVK